MKHASENQIAIVWGLTKGHDGTFINIDDYKFFKIPTSVIRKIEGIDAIIHCPEYFGNPASDKRPNNKAHVIVTYDRIDELDNYAARLDISEYCNKNYEDCTCLLDKKLVDDSLSSLRKLAPNTPYHKLWEFE